MLACHAGGPGSIPGRCKAFCCPSVSLPVQSKTRSWSKSTVSGNFIYHKTKTWPVAVLIANTFSSASALLAMQSAVLARGILSVRPSVRLSVTFRYCVQTNEDTIVRFSASMIWYKDNPSSFWRGKKVYPDIRRGSPPAVSLKWGIPLSIGKSRPIIGHNLETAQDRRLVTINH